MTEVVMESPAEAGSACKATMYPPAEAGGKGESAEAD